MKKQLRKEIIARRNSLTAADREEKSALITRRVLALPVWRQARIIMCYVSFGSEVNTFPLIQAALEQSKRLAVPLCQPEGQSLLAAEILDFPGDLCPGTWGILEPRPEALRPVAPELLDLVLVPGVAFDRSGNRLGYGAGYYDRFLATLRPGARTIALAFTEQIVTDVYPQAHDRPVDMVITDQEIIEPGKDEGICADGPGLY
ncbi:5-formyltetrahydrofolate cyclo-ligase [Moorella sp. Hama-1]|uniref:5-formyltetrahydrofolate cyclo-ligase n=1 Tax=Moorella sp. Hama-1 TaxID=2138101 RepID=UPI000D64B94E|nr:5-formyltetrahydrofolate cyclo-ligase [Moorella sp. Hama-1]BCV22713.1 5-formyltetrahydrofolate cyclo-ligase [Moorella sp. Hama-1]